MSKWGRRAFRRELFSRWAWRYMWIDTFGHHICHLIGHSTRTYEWDDGYGKTFQNCYRCNQHIIETAEASR